MGKITIDNFFGVWRNADQPDLPDGYFSELKDLIGRNGKLEKTYDFGGATAALTIPAGYAVYGMGTFIHDELPNDYIYILIMIKSTTPYDVKIYGYSGAAWVDISAVATYGTYYHKLDRNPIIQTHDAIRFLPGNVSMVDGAHESKGIWLGYIDRNYFWNSAIKTIADTFKSYDACLEQSAFSLLSVSHDNSETAGDLVADTYYYKIVPVFDGVQEALLPDDFVVGINALLGKVNSLQYTFQSLSAFNGRITGFNIYRASDTDTAYYKILEVSTLDSDPTLDYKANSIVGYGLYVQNAGWTADALENKGIIIGSKYSGYIMANSTDCIMVSNVFTSSEDYWSDGHYEIWDGIINYYGNFESGTTDSWAAVDGDTVANTGSVYHRGTRSLNLYPDTGVKPADALRTVTGLTQNTTYYVRMYYYPATSQLVSLKLDGVLKDSKTGAATTWHYLEGTVATGAGDTDITIYVYGALSGNLDHIYIDDIIVSEGDISESGDDGYCGLNTIINEDFELGIEDSKANYRAFANDSDGNNDATDFRRRISNNVRRAIKVSADFTSTAIGITQKSYICKNYLWQLNASGVDLWVYDDGLLPSPATTDKHPLLNEVSIKVNGELAMLYKGRLWQAVLVLDPGGEGEEHTEWIGYSYLTSDGSPCYDINPVSNIYPLPDREGGKITGWAAGFDSIFIFKAHSIFRLVISDITDPTSWVLKESNFDIGNLAKQGVVTVGNTTYFCAYDGIHTLDPNVGAETSQSPTLRDIITEPIRDIYIALSDSQKAAIQGEYDQINREIIWRFTSAAIWAYHTDTQQWRQKDTNQVIDLMGYDENSNILVYNNTDKKVYNIDTDGAVGIALRTKDYQISDDDPVVVRFITVVYKSVTELTLNFYTDNDDSTKRATVTLPASTTITQLTVAIRYYCNRFNVEIIDEVNSTTDTQINKLIIEHGD